MASASAPSINRDLKGFGEYQGFSPPDFASYLTTQKTHILIQSTLIGSSTVAVICASIACPPLAWAAPLALIPIAVQAVRTFLHFYASYSYFPPDLTQGLEAENFGGVGVGKEIKENGAAVALSNGVESKKYKFDLIRSAEHSIFLSTYMGEEAFDEALDLIKERMGQKQQLKVFLLLSDQFLTKENKRRLDALSASYPERFFCVLNPEIYYSEHPEIRQGRLCTNHIKLMAIDQGAYMIIGGCALRPFWTDVTGEQHLPRLESASFNICNPLEAKGFRDMDFAFKSGYKGSGMTAFLEGAKLMVRYAYRQDPALAERLKREVVALMRMPPSRTSVRSIDAHVGRAQQFDIKLYSTGPDHAKNAYLHALIELIKNARESIVIAHMYFHPPQVLIDALKEAADRGIKVEIITNSKKNEAPLAHRFFCDLAQMKYSQLFEGSGARNVKIREFYRANTTYHKKVAIVDKKFTAFGSSNLGKKSIEENPDDYEFNAIVHSSVFASKTLGVLSQDIALSEEVSPHTALNPTWDTRLFARVQEHVMTSIL